ncbi:MAG: ferritin-like domain-containing protein [Actinomycetota bacterium]|nr:ferritin-like domain-containing protein [Actinomycetota bacterium]
MAASSAELHESPDELSPETIDRHRAIVSFQEEAEAADWYDQRVDATKDAELAAILAHNRDEEKEHAAMLLEWIRRHDAVWDDQLRTYLFTDGPILEAEEEAMGRNGGGGGDGGGSSGGSGDLGIGSLREVSGS